MKIIPLINEFTNTFNKTFFNLNILNGNIFTLKLYESFLNYLDNKFKNSKDSKKECNIKKLGNIKYD